MKKKLVALVVSVLAACALLSACQGQKEKAVDLIDQAIKTESKCISGVIDLDRARDDLEPIYTELSSIHLDDALDDAYVVSATGYIASFRSFCLSDAPSYLPPELDNLKEVREKLAS